MDESALSAAIFDSLRKCIQLREKYTEIGLQRKQDNPRDYPNLAVAPLTSTTITALKVLKISLNCLIRLFSTNILFLIMAFIKYFLLLKAIPRD